MRTRSGWRWGLVGLLGALAGVAWPPPAAACGPLAPLPPVGLPRAGATGVSTATSLVVFSRGAPAAFKLQAGGQDVPLDPPVDLGGGADGASGPAGFWRIRPTGGFMAASVEHVLTANFQGSTVEVTRFTTAAGYDKAEGVAPVLNAVHLWRVRYPVADINSGNCVFSEYHGFITVDYVPGTVPNTAPGSVVHAFRLVPKNGGAGQTFLYTGETPFTGTEPMGAYPAPISAWLPELDPTRSYCLTVGASGDGDLARLPVESQTICADVVQLSAAGAPPPPQTGGGGGGCSVAGAGPGARAALLFLALVFGLAARRRR